MPCVRDDPIGEDAKKPRQSHIGDDNHQAEQQSDRVDVDRPVDVVEGKEPDRRHQARAEERRAGPIEMEAGQLADRHNQIGHGKDRDRAGRREFRGRRLPFGDGPADERHRYANNARQGDAALRPCSPIRRTRRHFGVGRAGVR